MGRTIMSTSALLLVATALILVSTTIPSAAAAGSGSNDNGVQDTMYDLEGSTDDMNQGGSGGGSRDGDASEAGSGEGSGSGEEPRIRHCQQPPSGTFPEPTDFEDQILPEIRCHLACVELVMELENVTFEISTENEIWPMIGDSVLKRNCSIYQKIEGCKQGCLTHALQPMLKDGRCALQCNRTCNHLCTGVTDCWIEGSSCSRACSEVDCLEGCQLYKMEISQTSNGALPPSPSNKPHLFAPQVAIGAGIYTVDPGTTPTTPPADHVGSTSGEEEEVMRRPLTSFIVRVVHEATNRIAFFWLHSLDDIVNLGAFSCLDDVLVQYAAVNKYGRSSKWSPSTEIDVYGANGIPSPENPSLENIRFAIRPDQRFGFWKHGVVSVYWNRPQGFHYVSNYIVTLHPSSFPCGRRQIIINVPRERTRADIMAKSPNQGPVDGCVYEISVASVAVTGMTAPPVRKVLYSVQVDNPIPIDFQCIRSWSDVTGTFQFQLNWTIPNFPDLHNAITKFHILLTFLSPEAQPEARDAAEILFDANQSKYYYFTRRVPFGATGSYYRIGMDSRSSPSNQILVPKSRMCEYDALPPPPNPPTTVAINNDSVRFQSVDAELGMGILTLDLEWNRVAGNISSYEVRLIELRPGAGDASEANVQEMFQPDQMKLSHESASLTVEVPSSTEDGCVYVQVRSISTHGGISNWSDPNCVYVAGLALPTMTTPTTTPTRSTDGTTSDAGSALDIPVEILYIILSVAGVVLVATVILTVFVCLACYQNRRVSKNAQLMRLSMQQSSFRKTMSPVTSPTKPPYQSPKLHFQGGNPIPPTLLQKSAKDWELHPCQIVVENKLGQGGFGDVYQGTIRGGVGIYKSNGPPIMRVAVKILRAASSLEEKRSFLDHVEQAKLVTNQLTTPRVVKMVGCVTLHEPHCLVTELPARGDLLSYLVNARNKILNPELEGDSDSEYPKEPTIRYSMLDSKAAATVMVEPFREAATSSRTVEAKDLLNFSIQIASGMEYLSAIGVVHGDLACRNMYLDENRQLKISDFGINVREKGKHRLYVKIGHARLPLRWMAPEAIAEGQLTGASDVWAFGVTLWEIITLGGFPYIDVANKDILPCLMSGRRLKKPSNCAPEIYDVMKQCWKADKTDRPSFTTLHKTLQDYSTSKDLTNLVSLQSIDSQCSYYQPRRHQSVRGTGGERSERAQRGGEDGLESVGEERRQLQGEESGEQTIIHISSDALRTHHFSSHILPQILEDDAKDKTDEQETSKESNRVDESGSNKPSRSEEIDHGTLNSEGFVSGAVTPTSLEEEGQTEIVRLRSETTTPDSGYNMSQS